MGSQFWKHVRWTRKDANPYPYEGQKINWAIDVPCETKKRSQGEDNASARISDQAPICYMVNGDFHFKLLVHKTPFEVL